MRASICVGIVLVSGLATTAVAQDAVNFDARRLFSCAEVKPPQQADSARKVVLVVIPISANFNTDVKESTIESLRYELRFPKSVTVLDHLPKTQTGTNIVGAQREMRQEQRLTDLNVKFGGGGRIGFSVNEVGISMGGDVERSKRELNEVKTNIQVDRLPARDQIVVAGTHDEGQTLYFDLKWHDQTTRAGATDYVFLAQVAKDWTGDVVTLACTARQNGVIMGRMTKVVGLYLSGNDSAMQRVEKQLETTRPTASSDELKFITNSVGMKMRLIPTGTFLMGTAKDTGEKFQHRVTLTRQFYMGVCEVTQSEYKKVMNSNPSRFQFSDELPVENVSWCQAVKFCNALSKKEGLKPFYEIGKDDDDVTVPDWQGEGYRLPTEAEWEYACRAGTTTRYWFGDNSNLLNLHAKVPEINLTLDQVANLRKEGKITTQTVGAENTKNQFDLCDMYGNVEEWCWDVNSEEFYKSSSANVNPTGPNDKDGRRIVRGGGFNSYGNFHTSDFRYSWSSHETFDCIGFRVVRTHH